MSSLWQLARIGMTYFTAINCLDSLPAIYIGLLIKSFLLPIPIPLLPPTMQLTSPFPGLTMEQYDLLLNMLAADKGTSSDHQSRKALNSSNLLPWILDSGASRHMTMANSNWLSNMCHMHVFPSDVSLLLARLPHIFFIFSEFLH